MVLRLLLPLAAAALHAAAPAAAQPVTTDVLKAHVDILASDAFEGRGPGTEGEKKTIEYISGQLRAYGLEPAGENGGWYQAVSVVTRVPGTQSATWHPRRRGAISLDQGELILVGRTEEERVARAPVWFVGHGGPEQLGDAKLKGAVVLLLYEAPADKADYPSFQDRAKLLAERGAAAVIAIFRSSMPWEAIQQGYNHGQVRLAADTVAPIQGALSEAGAARILAASGTTFEALAGRAYRPGFAPVRLRGTASLLARSDIRRIESNNVLGRIRGSGGTGESLLYLAHWDHLGICRPEGAQDRICNGAVDNASGIAAMLEIARRLAAGPRPQRDIVFLATTVEEMGLLGATHFARQPTVPLSSIVAAINLDTVAIAPKGEKVAVIGGGLAPLDAAIAATVREMGRELDTDSEAAGFITRQDGWALTRVGVPAIMVGGSFSDMKKLEAFLSGPYHAPGDDLTRPLQLEGAAEDADLLIALGRRLADPGAYSRPPALARP